MMVGESVDNEGDYHRMVIQTSAAQAPGMPRRLGVESDDGRFRQLTYSDRMAWADKIIQKNSECDVYCSVYSFPDGHSSYGNVPKVDTLFIDFDISPDALYRLTGAQEDWRTAMRALLTPLRDIALELCDAGRDRYWRAVLSGHKGVHLYLDFPALERSLGTIQEFKYGLQTVVSDVQSRFNQLSAVGVDDYFDADSADLSRVARYPNTIHPAASRLFGEPRWCVPVRVDELVGMTVDRYEELTKEPRMPTGWERHEAEKAAVMVRDRILSSVNHRSGKTVRSADGNKQFKRSRVRKYAVQRKAAHDGTSAADLWRQMEELDGPSSRQCFSDEEYDFLRVEGYDLTDVWVATGKFPCIKAFHQRDDQFDHRAKSHAMELFVMSHLVHKEVPYSVIVDDYFGKIPGFDEAVTRRNLNEVIGRDYERWSCEAIWEKAPRFCLKENCRIYRDKQG